MTFLKIKGALTIQTKVYW